MDIQYKVIQRLPSKDNQDLINYLDKILNHRVNNIVWDWEFNTIENTVFTVANCGDDIAGTQSMLPILLSINGKTVSTAKSETSYLDANYRGKQIFEKLYQLAVDETVKNGSKLIWGFTPALKAWKKNLAFETFDNEIQITKIAAGYFSFGNNYKKSRNILFALGKYLLCNLDSVRYTVRQLSKLRYNKSIQVTTQLIHADDIRRLYTKINKDKHNLIHIDMNAEYLHWRLHANPVVAYKQLFFYNNDELAGYIVYSIKDDILILTDITYNLDGAILQHMLKYVVRNNTGFHYVQYWGNVSNEINQAIFELMTSLGGKSVIDNSRNFVYKVFETKYTEICTNLKNWYINGLWTEGFHI